MTKTVRFHKIGGPEVLVLEDEEPGRPGPGEVLIRVEAIGLNRAEALFRTDSYVEPVKRFPARLGTEAAGVVEAVGEDVAGLRPGQPVSVLPGLFSQNDYGVYAERAIVPARAVLARPEGMNAIEGASVWMPYLTAYSGLVQIGGLKAGDTVVLTAASSSVGLAAIQVANRIGATPIALTRGEAKKQRLLEHGAAQVVVTDAEDVSDRVLEATNGRGAELVFDAVAGPGVTDLMKSTSDGGTVLLYGGLSGQPTPFPGLALGMAPVALRAFTIRETMPDPGRRRAAEAFIHTGLRSGALRPVLDRTFDLADIVESHRYLDTNAQFGKSVVTVGG
ncbi:zinc-dependent alcohol dehydrogenase family protein [Actinospica robiniae]|uniref:zinc-dependent alcohol dehydrogenase family protein n=1 Tax=Actinospica robiniae TaxID=304901 RepID=UPI00040C4869|nr:zinc-dependent alcohol dehydrogenase family protein [Actinospica robiniae]